MLTLIVGTYTRPAPYGYGRAEGLCLYRFDPDGGTLRHLKTIRGLVNPSFAAVAPNGRRLYAVNEIGSEAEGGGRVNAFEIDPLTAEVRPLNAQSTQGLAPAHVSLDQSGRFLLIANYGSGSLAVLPILPDGSLGASTHVVAWSGSGPHASRQEAPHAHMIRPGPDSRIYAVDLGTDRIMIYDLDVSTGRLQPADPPWLPVPPGSGPRHITFAPHGRHAYVITELNNTVVVFEQDASGHYQQKQVLPTLPPDFSGKNTCAAIHLSPGGGHLYASNRGHDSIAVFAVEPGTGNLTAEGHHSTLGHSPRDFILTPDGACLLAANQDSDTIVVFEVDRASGRLRQVGGPAAIASPVCLKWLPQ
jgi:6-phosphogluconolactonase